MKKLTRTFSFSALGCRLGVLALALVCSMVLLPDTAQAEKLYKWTDKSGQTHITSHYPSKSLRRAGSKVEIIDSNAPEASKVVIRTNTLSDEQRREIANRKKKYKEIESERTKLEMEKDYLEARVRKLKINLLRLEQKIPDHRSLSELTGDDIENKTRADKTKAALADNSSRLRSTELRILRLRQELENLK